MAEWWNWLDTRDLKSRAFGRVGSTPTSATDVYIISLHKKMDRLYVVVKVL